MDLTIKFVRALMILHNFKISFKTLGKWTLENKFYFSEIPPAINWEFDAQRQFTPNECQNILYNFLTVHDVRDFQVGKSGFGKNLLIV